MTKRPYEMHMTSPRQAEKLEKLKKKYVGKWIAAKGRKIVAVSVSHEEVLKELAKKDLSDVYVFYSPSPGEEKYEFLFMVHG